MNKTFIFIFLLASVLSPSCRTTQATTKSAKPEKSLALQQQISLIYVDACTEMVNGNVAGAKELFLQILKLDAKHHGTMYNLCLLYTEATTDPSDYNESVRMGEGAIALDPNNYWYYEALVDAYRIKGDMANAIRIKKIITQKFPKEPGVFNELADLYIRNKNYDEAIETLNQVPKNHENEEELDLQKYKISVEAGKSAQALTIIDKLIETHPEKAEYVYNKFNLLKKLGRETEGIEVLKNLLKRYPKDSFALLTLADLYKSQNNIEESDKYLFIAFSNPEIGIEGKANVIHTLIDYIDIDKSSIPKVRTLVGILAKTHPNTAIANHFQADLLSFDGKADSARLMYRKALLVEPKDDDMWEKMLSNSLKTNDMSRLQQDALDALEYFPNNDKFSYYLGTANVGIGEYEQAIFAFEKVKRRNVNNPELMSCTYQGLGTAYARSNQWQEAESAFEKALSLAPANVDIYNNYAYCLALQKDKFAKAKELMVNSLKIQPNNSTSQDVYAFVLYQAGEYEQALVWAEKSVMRQATPESLEHYGDILYKLGKKEEALSQWNNAIKAGNAKIIIQEKMKI